MNGPAIEFPFITDAVAILKGAISIMALKSAS
jgi:hypothetical protein